MANKVYKKKSEVAHHRSKALSIDVTTALERLLALLATLRTLKALEQLLKLINIEVVVRVSLTGRSSGHWFKL